MKGAAFALARALWLRVPVRVRSLPAFDAAGLAVRSWLGGSDASGEVKPPDRGPAPPMQTQATPPPQAMPQPRPAAQLVQEAPPAPQPEPPQPAAPENKTQAPAAAEPAIRVVRTLAELDAQLARLDAAAAISDDELRRAFLTFRMEFPLSLPEDPDSAEYRAAQMQLYEWLHGKAYTTANEGTPFDLPTVVRYPFPYSTQSPDTVGNQLIAVGYIIRTMGVRGGQSVIEFGPGWGNTTLALARMGCHVTAVDIEAKFLELIRQRARNKGLEVDTIHGDFSIAGTIGRQFDAVLFFECFHHCSNHQALIAALDRIVAPGGKVVFAAEPILDEFPLPWGLRLDGESLWAIRKHGWLELGFQETYFRGLLGRHGWAVEKTVCAETPWGVIYVARRKADG